jgi:hypothetical protein
VGIYPPGICRSSYRVHDVKNREATPNFRVKVAYGVTADLVRQQHNHQTSKTRRDHAATSKIQMSRLLLVAAGYGNLDFFYHNGVKL